MLEPTHIVGISETAYVPATPRFLEWRHDLQPAGTTTNDPPDSDSQAPCRRPAGRHRSARRSPRLPVGGVLVLDRVLDGRIRHRRPSPCAIVAASLAQHDVQPVGAPW